jgi:hypothetical protein
MKTLTCLALAAALAVAAGCSDDDEVPGVTSPDAAAGPDAAVGTPDGAAAPDGGAPDTAATGADAGAPDAEPASITLVDWVTDLTANHTTATSLPDTVEDKKIVDTSDPAAFDPLLQ